MVACGQRFLNTGLETSGIDLGNKPAVNDGDDKSLCLANVVISAANLAPWKQNPIEEL